jgi:hypothetical protein
VGRIEYEGVQGIGREPIFPHVLCDFIAGYLGLDDFQPSLLEMADELLCSHQTPQKL